MAQSLDAQVGVAPLRREVAAGARSPAAFERTHEDPQTAAPARGIDVFRLVVALTGLAAFLTVPAALIAAVALLVR